MAIQTINIGSSANKGDGDPLRTAFKKINANFAELDVTNSNRDINGSVFGDDSTLLVDAVNNIIPSAVVSGTEATNWNTAYGWGDHSTQNYIVDGTADAITATMVAEDVITSRELADGNSYNGTFDGDITGSVFADDSTLLVDAVNGLIPTGIIDGTISNNIDTASLRTSEDKIALGNAAGGLNQSQYGIGIGFGAGAGNQEDKAISIGHRAGQVSQGASAVAIGNFAGNTVQGQNAVALGSQAGENNQASNSVVINATGSVLENTTASSLVIKPIRNATMTTILGYDATSGEVTHNAAIPGYISLADLKTEVAASADFADFQTRIAAL